MNLMTLAELSGDVDLIHILQSNVELFHGNNNCIIRDFKHKSSAKCKEKMKEGKRLFTTSPSSTSRLLKLYNEAVAHAPNDSVELARAYGNRSAVLYNVQLYEDSLMDIDRALALKCPDSSKYNLYARKAKNLLALGPKHRPSAEKALAEAQYWLKELSNADKSCQQIKLKELSKQKVFQKPFEKPDHSLIIPDVVDPNENLIGASKAIELQYSKKYGRHFVATRDIKPGEVLVKTQSYIFQLPENMLYVLCWNCAKRTWASVPCKNCTNVMFCNENCRDEAWNNFHDIECPTFDIMPSRPLQDGVILGMKITIKALKEAGSVTSLKEMVEKIDSKLDPLTKGFIEGKFDESKYASIYSLTDCRLQSNKEFCLDRLQNSVLVACIWATETKIFGKKIDNANDFVNNDSVIFIVKLLYENIHVGLMNLFRVHKDSFGRNEMVDVEKIMVSCLTSLFNHSCDPNGYLVHFKDIQGIRSIHKINKGQQVFISYINGYDELPTIERQRSLQNTFEFWCDCHACKGNWGPHSSWPSFMMQSPSLESIWNVIEVLSEIENQLGMSYENTKSNQLLINVRHVPLLSKVLNILQENLHYPCKEIVKYKTLLKRNLFNNSG